MITKCDRCFGDLDTGYRCASCGAHCPPVQTSTSDNTSTCTAGNGWCPIHGENCPIKYPPVYPTEKLIPSCMVDSVVGFSYVDITTEGLEGCLNLLWGDYPIAMVGNVHIANQIRKIVPLRKLDASESIPGEEPNLRSSDWDADGRCIYCGAGKDSHQGYICTTYKHLDRREENEATNVITGGSPVCREIIEQDNTNKE